MGRLIQPEPVLDVPGTPPGMARIRITSADGTHSELTMRADDAYDNALSHIKRDGIVSILVNHKLADESAIIAVKAEKRIIPRRQQGIFAYLASKLFNTLPPTAT